MGGSGKYCLPFSCERFFDLPFYPWKLPPPSRTQTVPLPPVTPSSETWGYGRNEGVDYDGEYGDYPGGDPHSRQSIQLSTNGLAQEAELSTSLAVAKPKHRENETQSEVSFFFTPPKIMLSINGLDNSQVLRLPPVQGTVMTATGMLRKRASGLL